MQREISVSPDLIKSSLNLFDLQHTRLYKEVGFPEVRVREFVNDKLDYNKYIGTLNNLTGYQFQLMWLNTLPLIGAKDIKSEVPIAGTSLDALANIDGEPNTYECKCTVVLKDKCVKQIKKARTLYSKCHVVVPNDAVVTRTIERALYQYDADILRMDVSRKQVVDSILYSFKRAR